MDAPQISSQQPPTPLATPPSPEPKKSKVGLVWGVAVIILLIGAYAAWGFWHGSSSTTKDPQPVPSASSSKTVLTYAVHWSDYQVNGLFDQNGQLISKGLQQYIDEYEGLHPDIDIKVTYIDFSKYPDTLKLLHEADAAPDIYQIYSTWGVSLARGGVFAAPPADVVKDVTTNYTSTAGVAIDGKIWGIPTEINDYVLVYNKQLFAAAGITQAPKTWAQFAADALKLTKHDAHGAIIEYGTAFTPRDFIADPYLSLLFSNGGGYLSSDLTKCKLNDPAGIAALEAMTSLFKKNVTDLNGSVAEFGVGKVAMVFMAPWQKNGLVKSFGSSFDEMVGVAPIPYLTKPASLQYSWFMGVMSKSRHQQEAWDFLRWFTGEVQPATGTTRYGDLLAQTIGAIPSRKGDIAGNAKYLTGDSFKKVFIDQLPNSIPEPNVANAAALKEIMTQEITKAWAGTVTARQALDNACTSINALLSAR